MIAGRATLHEWALMFYGTSTVPDRSEYALYSPASANAPKKPFIKLRESNYSKNALNPFATKGKQNKSVKSGSGMSQPYVTGVQSQSVKKGKARGQHKNGKSANRPTARPTVQALRGLNGGRGSGVTSRPRGRSTTRPILNTTLRTSTARAMTKPPKQRITEATVSPQQRGLILMEPPAKSSTNKVPVVFQQYPKIQQLYPLYPIYAGARGVDQHAGRAKGLDLLQDQQFDSRNLQITDKGIAML